MTPKEWKEEDRRLLQALHDAEKAAEIARERYYNWPDKYPYGENENE